MTEQIVKHKSKVPGIYFTITTVGSHKYLKVIHEKSRIPVTNFWDRPVKAPTKIMKLIEPLLAEADWTVTKSKIGPTHEAVYNKIAKAMRGHNDTVYVDL